MFCTLDNPPINTAFNLAIDAYIRGDYTPTVSLAAEPKLKPQAQRAKDDYDERHATEPEAATARKGFASRIRIVDEASTLAAQAETPKERRGFASRIKFAGNNSGIKLGRDK
ncbi:MAG: hypothetical protein WD851_19580 [Pirellulales bacterium]